jgi:hypothetical protein
MALRRLGQDTIKAVSEPRDVPGNERCLHPPHTAVTILFSKRDLRRKTNSLRIDQAQGHNSGFTESDIDLHDIRARPAEWIENDDRNTFSRVSIFEMSFRARYDELVAQSLSEFSADGVFITLSP